MSEEKECQLIKVKCPFCKTGDVILPEWQYKIHEEDKDFYCSEECRYEAETGNSGEEY